MTAEDAGARPGDHRRDRPGRCARRSSQDLFSETAWSLRRCASCSRSGRASSTRTVCCRCSARWPSSAIRTSSNLGLAQVRGRRALFGRVGARKLARGYATAVFEDSAAVADSKRSEDELFRFGEAVRVERRAALGACRTRAARSETGASSISRLLRTVVRVRRLSGWRGRVARTVPRPCRARSTGWPSVRPKPGAGGSPGSLRQERLDESERDELEQALQELTGGPVELLVTEDAELLGGAVVAVGEPAWSTRALSTGSTRSRAAARHLITWPIQVLE